MGDLEKYVCPVCVCINCEKTNNKFFAIPDKDLYERGDARVTVEIRCPDCETKFYI